MNQPQQPQGALDSFTDAIAVEVGGEWLAAWKELHAALMAYWRGIGSRQAVAGALRRFDAAADSAAVFGLSEAVWFTVEARASVRAIRGLLTCDSAAGTPPPLSG